MTNPATQKGQAVLFTYSGGLSQGTVYPQSCLNPDKVLVGIYDAYNGTGLTPTDVQMSYCNSGDGKTCAPYIS